MSTLFIAFIVIFILLAIGAPIGVALGLGTLVGVCFSDLHILFFTQRLWNNFDSFPLMAIPFFVFAGEIMEKGTLANSLLAFCRHTSGHLKAGLAHISVITGLFYGALCGSAAATTAAVGGTMIPAMKKDNYALPFSTAVNSAAGSLGVMIPPSIPLILFGAFGNVSITNLFIAGIIPGFAVAAGFMITNYIIVSIYKYGTIHPKSSWKERLSALANAKYALGVPVIVLGAIYGGIATPTEAGSVAVVYALVIETFVTKSMSRVLLRKILVSTLQTCGMIFLIVIAANTLGTFMQYYKVEVTIIEFVRGITTDTTIFFLLILVLYLILGMFLDATATIIIFTPILVPLAISYGIDPVHFGMFSLIALCVGLLTPPVGTNLFVGCSVSGLDLMSVSKAVLPFIFSMLLITLLFAYVPWLSLCLL